MQSVVTEKCDVSETRDNPNPKNCYEKWMLKTDVKKTKMKKTKGKQVNWLHILALHSENSKSKIGNCNALSNRCIKNLICL